MFLVAGDNATTGARVLDDAEPPTKQRRVDLGDYEDVDDDSVTLVVEEDELTS